MATKLNETQLDALADCITMLVELARKRRLPQQPSTVSDSTREGDSAQAVAASSQTVQRGEEVSSGIVK